MMKSEDQNKDNSSNSTTGDHQHHQQEQQHNEDYHDEEGDASSRAGGALYEEDSLDGGSEAAFQYPPHSGRILDESSSSVKGGGNGNYNHGNSSKEPRKLQRPIQRGAQACSQCRSHKIKCVPSDVDTPFPCMRCVNQNLVCEVLKHNRGRKRKSNTGEVPPPAKRQAAVFYPSRDNNGNDDDTPESNSKTTSTSATTKKTKSASQAVAGQSSQRQRQQQPPTLSLNTASTVSRNSATNLPSQSQQSSPIYDQSGNNLHVLEQAIAMHGGAGTGAPPSSLQHAASAGGNLPPPQPPSQQQAIQHHHSLPPPYLPPLPHHYHQAAAAAAAAPRSATSASVHPQASDGANGYYNTHSGNSNSNIIAGSSSASASPRLSTLNQQQQQQHQEQQQLQGQHLSASSIDPAISMPKTTLPYQYGASAYALPQPQTQSSSSSMPPPHQTAASAAYTYHHQQPTQLHQLPNPSSTSSSSSNLGNPNNATSNYTYQPAFPTQSLPPPPTTNSQLPQSQSYHSGGSDGTGTGSASYSGRSSNSNNTNVNTRTTILPLPNVAKPINSPTRMIQDSIQSDSQSQALESLKFPFLLPKNESRNGSGNNSGRRGLFSLKNIMKPEDVEEIAEHSSSSNTVDTQIGGGDVNRMSGKPKNKTYSHEFLLANDPLQAGIISQEDATTLFKLYMDEMSVMNCLLDPTIHTHDFVREKSKFLYCAILSVISRYLNSTTFVNIDDGGTNRQQPRRLISPVYSYCKQAAGAHLKEVLGNVECSLEVIQGLAVLTFHKEPEDEKACLHLYRAIAIAREIGLDRETLNGKHDITEEERLWIRIKQRVWLSLFVANTILTMQFDMNTLIGPDDTAIAASSRFAVGSHLQADTLLVASVQLRRLWHIYSDMARALEHVGETSSEKAAKLVSLSMLTRTANRELEQAAKDWKDECIAVGLVRIDSKIDVWVAAIKLRLNLSIVQMALPGLKERASMISNGFLPPKKTNQETGQSIELGCISAFHQSVNSACFLLQCMTAMEEKRLLSFAADTFLSFSIYSAFFLWTLCRDMGPSLLEPGEVDHCFALIASAATALESASLYPGDSCALHARFLRNLQATRTGNQLATPQLGHPASGVGSPSHGIATSMANDAMRDDTGGPARERTTPLPASHPLAILSQMQPAPQAYTSMPNADVSRSSGQQSMMGGNGMTQGYGAGIDSMLMADWGTMQKDFPWVSSDITLPFLDGTAPPMQPVPMNAYASQRREAWP